MAKQTTNWKKYTANRLQQYAKLGKDREIREGARAELQRRAENAEAAAATKLRKLERKAPKSTNTTPLAILANQRVNGTPAQQAAAAKELAQVKAVRDAGKPSNAAKAPLAKAKAPKLAAVPTDAARSEDALAAIDVGKAPTGKEALTVRGSYLAYLAASKGQYSDSYADGLVRSLGEFAGWLQAQGVTQMAKVDTAALLAYRQRAQHTPKAALRSLATLRKELDRVRRFLLWLPQEERPRLGDGVIQSVLAVGKKAKGSQSGTPGVEAAAAQPTAAAS